MATAMADKADLTDLFDRLSRSAFRQRFRLLEPERGYLRKYSANPYPKITGSAYF